MGLGFGLGFRVWGLGFRVSGLGSLGFRVYGLGLRPEHPETNKKPKTQKSKDQ